MNIRHIYWRLLEAFGFGRLSWDRQFEAGVWDYIGGQRNQHTIAKVLELCDGGRLIEFGAGEGTLPLSLPKNSFSNYVGYDISTIAIGRAIDRISAAGITDCQFEQCDMAKWTWTQAPSISLVVVEECLYYLNAKDAEAFLQQCCQSLLPDGSILAIVHCAKKHFATLDICRRVCRVKEELTIDGRIFMILASHAG
jgi:cyclopropane fatty-acyl-phospholipid synthase-like methyltransferase